MVSFPPDIHLDGSAKQAMQRYRQLGRSRVRTTSRNPALRFFRLGCALLLLNVWVYLRWVTTRLPQVGPAQLDLNVFRLHRFVVFLRRAIEQHLGVIDSSPIYSS